jgi:hypothetical protein
MAFNFFYIKEENSTYGKIPVKYPKACPIGEGNGLVDVHGKMRWSNSGNREEVPRLLLSEYTLDYSRWSSNLNAIESAVNNINNGAGFDPYLKLYSGTPTNFWYNLPYLVKPGDSIRGEISNTWEDIDTAKAIGNTLGGKVGSIISKAGEVITGAAGQFSPGFGTEPIRGFKSTADNKIIISFPLYNTYSIKEANDHFSFVSLIAFQNLKTRTSFVSFLPPKIYNIDGRTSGGVYMAAAYISDLKIDSIGTTRCFSELDENTIIPEAYKVTITFTDLLTQSANVMYGALGGQKVQVIDPFPSGATGSGDNLFSNINKVPGIMNPIVGLNYQPTTPAPIKGG